MNHRTKQRLRKWALGLLLVYVAGGMLLFLLQDLLLFHGKAVQKNHVYSFNEPFKELDIPRGNNNLSILKFKTIDTAKGLVLFFHGNMKNVEHYKQYPAFFLRNGYEVWMIDYPGFGKTTGKRTEQRIYNDALLMYEMAVKQMPLDKIVIYGKSIGTGVASHLAARKSCMQLILETPYYNIDALAKHYFPIYPVIPLTKYAFPTNQNLPKVTSPVTLLHGTDDEIIPYKQAQKLKSENTPVELVTIKNGKHNNLWQFEQFQNKIDSLLGK